MTDEEIIQEAAKHGMDLESDDSGLWLKETK